MRCDRHSEKIKSNKRLNIKMWFSFLVFAIIILMLFNFRGITSYFNKTEEKINNVSVNPNYTITFNANAGYAFTNWNTKQDNTGIFYTNEEEVINLGDITLYAQWE